MPDHLNTCFLTVLQAINIVDQVLNSGMSAEVRYAQSDSVTFVANRSIRAF